MSGILVGCVRANLDSDSSNSELGDRVGMGKAQDISYYSLLPLAAFSPSPVCCCLPCRDRIVPWTEVKGISPSKYHQNCSVLGFEGPDTQ